jgi:hypothetical protein
MSQLLQPTTFPGENGNLVVVECSNVPLPIFCLNRSYASNAYRVSTCDKSPPRLRACDSFAAQRDRRVPHRLPSTNTSMLQNTQDTKHSARPLQLESYSRLHSRSLSMHRTRDGLQYSTSCMPTPTWTRFMPSPTVAFPLRAGSFPPQLHVTMRSPQKPNPCKQSHTHLRPVIARTSHTIKRTCRL